MSVLVEAIGDIDGINKDFTTPSPYITGTLYAYVNGQLRRKTDDDGPIEMGANRVRMRVAPRLYDSLHFWYWDTPSTGGAILGPPDMMETILLAPDLYGAIDLVPSILVAEGTATSGESPQMIGNAPLIPVTDDIVDLRPEILSVEEV